MSPSEKSSAPSRADAAPSWRLLASGVLALIAVVAVVVNTTRAVVVPTANAAARSTRATANPSDAPTASASASTVSAPTVSPTTVSASPASLTNASPDVGASASANAPARPAPRTAQFASASSRAARPAPSIRALEWHGDATLTEAAPAEAAQIGMSVGAASNGTTTFARAARVPMTWHTLTSYPGVAWAATEITDASSGTSAMSGAHAVRAYSSLSISVDMDSVLGWKGLKLYAQHKTKTGRNGSGEAAFVQNYSNIDAQNFRDWGEAWIEQRLWQDKLRIKAGRLDFNSEFAGTDNGTAFLNASMGYSPAITAAPTFPLPSSAINVIVSPRDQLTLSFGVFDGIGGAPAVDGHSSLFQIAQASQLWTLGGSGLAGRVGVGAWRHTGRFSAVTDEEGADPSLAGTHGWYATLDQTVWRGAARTPDDDNSRPRIAAYAQVGQSDPRVDAVHAHEGGGLTFSGLLPSRPSDLLGFGTTHAAWASGHELIGEVFYQFPVTSHLSFIADLQRVNRWNDGMDLQRGVVATWRTILTF